MNLTDRTKCKLTEIATVERAQSNRVYPSGTVYIQVSATNGQVHQLTKNGTIEGKYATIIPKTHINPSYFYIAVKKAVPYFLARYKSTINIQMKDFEMFDIDIHNDPDTQQYIADVMEVMSTAEAEEENYIELLKEAKRLALGTMKP